MSRMVTIEWPETPTDGSAFSCHSPPSVLHPHSVEVHVRAAWLAVGADTLDALAATLSASERKRAGRFHFERHRNRFMAGRGLLRMLLGRYLQTAPERIQFTYGPQGKPALAGPFAQAGLEFNMAHTQDLALFAVTRAGPVGIDVEEVRSLADAEELVARFFSGRESAAFRKLPEEQKPPAFFNLWTRKEAWLKATGEGIVHSLHRVEVSFLPGEPARLLSLPEPLARSAHWGLHDLAPAPGFAAALAIAAGEARLRCWRWPEALMGGQA